MSNKCAEDLRKFRLVQAGAGIADSAGVAAIYGIIIIHQLSHNSDAAQPSLRLYDTWRCLTTMTFCCVLICLSACPHVWVSLFRLIRFAVALPIQLRLPATSRSLPQLMLASEAHTLSLSTHCKLHRVRAVERGKEMLFTFSMPLFTSYFWACALAFSELRPQQFQLCVSLSQDQVTFRYCVAPQRVVYLHFRVCVFRFFLFCFSFTNCRPKLLIRNV